MRGTLTLAALAAAVFLCSAVQVAWADPSAVKVRAADIFCDERAAVAADGPVGSVAIVAARNGSFSGRVLVSSAETIKGLRGSVSALKTDDGTALADRCTQIRYAVAFDDSWRRYRPGGLDVILESAPESVSPRDKGPALAAVWLTVTPAKDAKAGLYKGEMTVEAAGLPATKVPVEVTVTDWTVPAAHDWRTWVGMIQSPDSLSMEYEVPMWSEEHWKLIARSFHYMSELGCRIVYVPLLARTNFGNSESMVRWIDKGDGRYDYDYSIMDRYLDLAEECLGKPQIVTFQAWEVYLAEKSDRSLSGQNREAAREIRAELKGKGPRVTVVDPKTGKAEMVYLPDYGTPQSKAQWQPLFDELHKRMKSRGLEKTMMLGMVSDVMPPKEDVAFLNEVSGGLAWVSHAHPTRLLNKPAVGNAVMHKIADLGYEAHVYNLGYQVNPEKSRRYGWQRDTLVVRFARNGWPNSNSFLQLRLLPAFNITGEQRGIGRLGVDTWFIAKDRRGQRVGAAYDRYPEVKWRNLDIENWILAPAAGGPVATGRFENLREGLEECEARITIESALTDPGKKKRLGDALAGECEKLLKERQRAMWQSIWSNDEELDAQNLVSARHPIEALWYAWAKQGKSLPGYWDGEARKMRDAEEDKGRARFAASPWRERNERLFTLAGQVERKLSGSAALGAATR